MTYLPRSCALAGLLVASLGAGATPVLAQECETTSGATTPDLVARNLACGDRAVARDGDYTEGVYRPETFDNTLASTAIGHLSWNAGEQNTTVGAAAMAGYLTKGASIEVNGTTFFSFTLNAVTQATAIGASARAEADYATALGAGARASAQSSLALGQGALATAQGSVAIGQGSEATQTATVSFGNDATKRRLVNIADGIDTTDAATVGQMNTALASASAAQETADSALAAAATNAAGIAANTGRISALEQTVSSTAAKIGYLAVNAKGDEAIATGADALALGVAAKARGNNASAVGSGALAAADNSSAFGSGARVALSGTSGTAVGYLSSASGTASSALGRLASAQGFGSVAVGNVAATSADLATAIGQEASAGGVRATAIGSAASATGLRATVIGADANASHANSTAVGAFAQTTADNQVMLGGAGSSIVIADIDASTSAQQGPVDVVTIDASGVLGRQAVVSQASMDAGLDKLRSRMDALSAVTDAQFAALSSDVAALGGRVNMLEQGLADTTFRLEAYNEAAMGGIAAATALGSAIALPDKAFTIAGNLATHGGQQGYAASLLGRVNDSFAIGAGVAGNTGDDEITAQVGVAFGF